MQTETMNKLGSVIEIDDCNSMDEAVFLSLRKKVPEIGVVVLKKQIFDVEQLVKLTKKFGEPVVLPEGLRFNNIVKEHPEIARVSNILPNGELIDKHAAAEYWHNDGNFWQPEDKYIFNFLYSEIAPPVGGQTGFVDLRLAYEALPDKVKQRIAELNIKVCCKNIPDFKNASPEELQPDALHAIKHTHVETGATGLYFGNANATIDGVSKAEEEEIMGYLLESIENPDFQYIHQYEPGDLLIWDNTTVMHRGLGGYMNEPRLLFRTQAFIKV